LGLVAGFMLLKATGIYVVARIFRSDHRDAIRIALLLAQGGEFAFVLYSAAAEAGVIDAQTSAILTAVVILSMVLTPLAVLLMDRLMPNEEPSLDGMLAAEGLSGAALVIGFGRFGQIVAQFMLARGVDVTIIDSDPNMIRNAGRFGFKIYFGDGTRRDVMIAAGADKAEVIWFALTIGSQRYVSSTPPRRYRHLPNSMCARSIAVTRSKRYPRVSHLKFERPSFRRWLWAR
jgi:glutathione-regulated potassium-efflux system protein KefB